MEGRHSFPLAELSQPLECHKSCECPLSGLAAPGRNGCNVTQELDRTFAPRSGLNSYNTAMLADLLVRGTRCPHLADKPLTGKLDAGNPPVQFGGMGEVNPSSLSLSHCISCVLGTAHEKPAGVLGQERLRIDKNC